MGGIVSTLSSARFCHGLGFVTSENSIPRICVATEAAIAIDLILEKILSHLDTTSVKTCRRVSSRWKELGAAELRKRVFIRIHLFYRTKEDRLSNAEQLIELCGVHPCYKLGYFPEEGKGPHARLSSSRISLDTLLSLIKTSNNFPCNSFVISSQTISSVQMYNLLETLRLVMKTLELRIDMLVEPTPDREDQDDSWVYDDLKTLFSQGQGLTNYEIVRHSYEPFSLYYLWMTLYIKAIFNETRRGGKSSDHISTFLVKYY